MRFLVAGSVPHPAFEGLADELRALPNVTYLGPLPSAEIPGLLGLVVDLVAQLFA